MLPVLAGRSKLNEDAYNSAFCAGGSATGLKSGIPASIRVVAVTSRLIAKWMILSMKAGWINAAAWTVCSQRCYLHI